MKKYKPAYVEWIDSKYCTSNGWEYLEDLPDIEKPSVCYSVGMVLKKTKRVLRLVCNINHMYTAEMQVGGVLDIPTIAIKKLRYLK